jgi:hypothetical protein
MEKQNQKSKGAADLPDKGELPAASGRLVVNGAKRPRAGWAVAARKMRARGEDRLLDLETSTQFDQTDWKW